MEADTPAALKASAGVASLDILVLPHEAADSAWVLDTPGGRELVLSTDPVWVAASGKLAGRSAGVPDVLRYSQESASFEAVGTDGFAPATAVNLVDAELIRPALPVPPSFGSVAGRASAPTAETIAELAQAYRVALPPDAFPIDGQAGGSSTELEIHWAGDVAQLLVDGTAVADRFWDGSPWIVDIHDAGIGPDSDVVLQILPLAKGADVGLPLEAKRRRDATPTDLVSLDSLRVVRWSAWAEQAGR